MQKQFTIQNTKQKQEKVVKMLQWHFVISIESFQTFAYQFVVSPCVTVSVWQRSWYDRECAFSVSESFGQVSKVLAVRVQRLFRVLLVLSAAESSFVFPEQSGSTSDWPSFNINDTDTSLNSLQHNVYTHFAHANADKLFTEPEPTNPFQDYPTQRSSSKLDGTPHLCQQHFTKVCFCKKGKNFPVFNSLF